MVMITKHTKIVGIASLVTTVGVAVLLGSGMYLVHTTEHTLIAKQQQMAELRFRINESRSVTSLVDGSTEERAELAHYILRNEDVIEFLTLVESIGTAQGVTLEIPKLEETSLNESFDELQLDMLLEGPRVRLMSTLAIFESLPYQSHISSITLNKKATQVWTASLTLYITKYKMP